MSRESEELVFDHFTVKKTKDGKWDVLGRGGMGITYRANDTKLRRTVALKVINPTLLDEEDAYKMFLREARAAANLNHRNVAQVFQVGSEEDKVYFAMEFIEGETLDKLVKRRKAQGHPGLELKQALHICQQTVQALLAAEKKNLVHRDIKPANIMVTAEDDGEMLVKLIDFGLAKSLQNKGEHSVFVSQPGFMGTPTYASPEQITDQDNIDIRADFYSLGATLWYMIEGKPPFISDNAFELYNQHLQSILPEERLTALAVPPCIIELLKEMLGKHPDERPQNARVLLDKIRHNISELGYSGPTEYQTLRENDNIAPNASSAYPATATPNLSTGGMSDGLTQIVPSQSSHTVSHTSRNRFPLVLIGVTLTIAVGGGIWWWINENSKKNDPPFAFNPDESTPPTPPKVAPETTEPAGPPPVAQVDPATKALQSAHALRGKGQSAAALPAYLNVQTSFAGSPEAEQAKQQIDQLVTATLKSITPAQLAEWQPVRSDLQKVATSGSHEAAHLAGLLYRSNDPDTAKKLFTQAATTYKASNNQLAQFSVINELLDLNPDAAARNGYLTEIEQLLTAIGTNPAIDQQTPAWEAALTRAANHSSKKASMVLADQLSKRDPTGAIRRFKQKALQDENEGQWNEAVQTYLHFRKSLPDGTYDADIQLNRLFDQWLAPGSDTLNAADFASLQPTLEEAAGLGFANAMQVLARYHSDAGRKTEWHQRALDAYIEANEWKLAIDLLLRLGRQPGANKDLINEKIGELITHFSAPAHPLDANTFSGIRNGLEQLAELPHLGTAAFLADRLAAAEPKEGFRWIRLIASQQNASPEAQFRLARAYETGSGTESDNVQAIAWYHKSADQFINSSQPVMALPSLSGLMRLEGDGNTAFQTRKSVNNMMRSFTTGAAGYTDKEFVAAEAAVTELAQLGNIEAMELLGTKLIESNPTKADTWLMRAAQSYEEERYWLEAVQAYTTLAESFPDRRSTAIQSMEAFLGRLQPGENLSLTDLSQLTPYLERASELPVVSAMSLLWMNYKASDAKKSIEWLTKAAQANDTAAMIQLGLQYSNGHQVEQSFDENFAWLSRAHDKKDLNANVPLADCYLRGKGTAPNPQRAIELLEEAVEDGNTIAMNLLGGVYYRAENYSRAKQLFEQAVELGYAASYGNLGVIYIKGLGVEVNAAKAVDYWKRGINKGDVPSMYFYGTVVYSGGQVGVEKNETEGLLHVRQAAEADFIGAINWLEDKGIPLKP